MASTTSHKTSILVRIIRVATGLSLRGSDILPRFPTPALNESPIHYTSPSRGHWYHDWVDIEVYAFRRSLLRQKARKQRELKKKKNGNRLQYVATRTETPPVSYPRRVLQFNAPPEYILCFPWLVALLICPCECKPSVRIVPSGSQFCQG